MYCNFCGNKLFRNAKYCNRCGRKIEDPLNDTQPLPVINEALFHGIKQPTHRFTPWYNAIFPKKTFSNRSKARRILYDLFSLAAIVAWLYILATFKTIREYQYLAGILGGLMLIYIWWKR